MSAAAYNYLDYDGLFIFDLNTEYKYREILGEQTIAENREEGSFIWENYYDEAQRINEYQLTLFVKEKEDLYRKFEETHYQRHIAWIRYEIWWNVPDSDCCICMTRLPENRQGKIQNGST